MSNFIIVTDSSADMPSSMVQELGVAVLPLSFTIGGQTYHNYPDNREMEPKRFYQLLREGAVATTAAVNVADYTTLLEPLLQSGKDVLILSFSSGLSATYQSSAIAAQEMTEKFPDRKIFAVDTLCASLGQGLFIQMAVDRKRAGHTIEEIRDWAEDAKQSVAHWVTVDDLHFLRRGGRVSSTTAVVGSMLHIKPIIHVDTEGRLVNLAKTRGRAASLTFLADKVAQTGIHPEAQTIYISHGDCLEDAEKLAHDLKTRVGVKGVVLNEIGPVVGAHAGPGCVAMFFIGSQR